MAEQNRPQPLEQRIDSILSGPTFKSLNHDQRKVLRRELSTVTVSASVSHQYSGPLPPPELLAQFNEVIPNGAERLMAMVEQQHNHRIAIEKTVVTNQQRQSSIGQYFALAITIAGLSLSGWLVATGHDWAGGTIGVATVGSVAVAFITGRNKQQADLNVKAEGANG